MESDGPKEPGNWSVWLIHGLVHPFTIFATPTFVFVLMIYFVLHDFGGGFAAGMRSTAGVLFPLIMATFVFIFQKELLQRLGRLPTLMSFLIALIIGLLVMVAIRLFARSDTVPIAELVLSGSFSLLVFSYASLGGNKMLSYYYGMISGFLLYIIFVGFPVLR